MKKILLLIALILAATPLLAQTTVNLSTTDTPDGQTWNNGTWSVSLVVSPPNPAQSAVILSGGGSISPQSGILSGTGTASFSLPANVNIGPTGTSWSITVCTNTTTGGCFTQTFIVTTSSPQTLALTPPSPRFPAVAYGTTGYLDAEITNPVEGTLYWNVTNGVFRVNHNGAWINGGGGSSGITPPAGDIGGTTGSPSVTGLRNITLPTLSGATGFLRLNSGAFSAVAGLASGDIPNNAANTTGTSANITGILAPANGGCGLANPTAHLIFITEGSSNCNLLGSGALTGQSLQFVNGADPIAVSPGVAGRTVSGTSDTILGDSGTTLQDRLGTIQYTSASAVAVTQPLESSAGMGSNFAYVPYQTGVGTVTITPTSTDTINGQSSIALTQNAWCAITNPTNNGSWLGRCANWVRAGTNLTAVFNADGSTTFNATAGGSAWSALSTPAGNLSLNMGTFTSTFNYSSNLAAAFSWLNTTAATSGANQSGPQGCFGGQYWTGSVTAADSYCLADVISAGTNPTTTATFTHAGSTGTNQFSAGGWLFGSGGGITPPGGVSISFAPTGANQSLTLRGAFISAGNSGLFLAQGGNNSGTGTAGNMQVFAGGNSSTGPNGALQIGGEYVKGTTVTVNNLETISADSTIADAAASPVSVAGTAFGTVTANPIQVLYTGEALINSSAAAAVNQTVCAGATASQVTPSTQYSCPSGPAVGIVKSIANNGASSTLPLVALNAKIGGPLTAFVTSNYTNATTTFSNVTGLSFPVAANLSYKVRCDLDYQTSATTADVKIQWTGPASPTNVTYDMVSQVTGSTLSSSVATAFSTALTEAGTPTTATNFPLTLTLTLINGSTAGTIQLQAAATGTGTITIIPGSCSLM